MSMSQHLLPQKIVYSANSLIFFSPKQSLLDITKKCDFIMSNLARIDDILIEQTPLYEVLIRRSERVNFSELLDFIYYLPISDSLTMGVLSGLLDLNDNVNTYMSNNGIRRTVYNKENIFEDNFFKKLSFLTSLLAKTTS